MQRIGVTHNLIRAFLGAALLCLGSMALAHPMGNFSISHYARFEARPDALLIRYILDYAEIPTVAERSAMGTDNAKPVPPQVQEVYLKTKSAQLRDGLMLSVDGLAIRPEVLTTHLLFQPGAGGLDTLRVMLEMRAPLTPGAGHRIEYRDGNYPERTGWKEVIALGGSGVSLTGSTVPTTDRSQELLFYPTDAANLPPQVTEATFTVTPGSGGAAASVIGAGGKSSENGHISTPGNPNANLNATANKNTPQDLFTQAIATKALTLPILLLSLGIAFLFGAFHALSPGHGKAMVAAYLVGSRGTMKHAVFLGGVVTLTHTIGVFALGLITLMATRYIVPERLYPVLGALSGLAIVGIGFGLLIQRVRKFRAQDEEAGLESVDGAGDYAEFEPPVLPDRTPISLKTLIVLGITGGALPCPSALVVLLSAIALHRVAFGLTLIVAFSLGLAAVLTVIGLLVVRARGLLERMPISGGFVSRLPVVSAGLVTLIGFVLLFRALQGNF
ncbi:MAG TPA: hypothetical protein VKU00_09655 [Chthonomonadaceae bacterium]|nr:hypothetical protein [Chthonomonadaceae bacterium]